MSNSEENWNFDNCWPDHSAADCFKEVNALLSPDVLRHQQWRAQVKLDQERAIDYAIASYRPDDPYFPRPDTLPSFNDSTAKEKYPLRYHQYKAIQMQREYFAHFAQQQAIPNQSARMPQPPPMKIFSKPQSDTPVTQPHFKTATCKVNHNGLCCNKTIEYTTKADIEKHLLSSSHPQLRALTYADAENYDRLHVMCKWQDKSSDGRTALCVTRIPLWRLSEHIEVCHLKQA